VNRPGFGPRPPWWKPFARAAWHRLIEAEVARVAALHAERMVFYDVLLKDVFGPELVTKLAGQTPPIWLSPPHPGPEPGRWRIWAHRNWRARMKWYLFCEMRRAEMGAPGFRNLRRVK
jgi:hypothetical protein